MNLQVKFRNSWQLMLSSIQVLRSHPRLALFPLVTFLMTLLIFVFMFGLPLGLLALLSEGFKHFQPEEWQQRMNLLGPVIMAVVYVISMYVATYFNVAFYDQILKALSGEPVSIRAGMAFAWTKRLQILYWSLLASTVGIILRAIAERLGFIGGFVIRLIGLAWSVAAVFVIPVIIRSEEKNPVKMLRASVSTLKQTWGENLVAFIGTRLAGLLIIGPSFVLCGLLALLSIPLGHPAPAILAGALFLLILFATVYLGSLTEHIFRCATYVYATEGVVPQAYTSEQLDQAWKVRGK